MNARRLLWIAFFPLIASAAGLAFGNDLQGELKDREVGKHWIYNDWDAAKAVALKEKKPIFVLFR